MATQLAEKTQFEPELVSLAGKIIVVTGGTTGIGRATAGLLATHGAKVVITGRHEREMNDTLQDLQNAGGECHGVIADNAYEDQIVNIFEETQKKFGDVDILINNAGIAASSALETSYEDMLYAVRVNILGYLTCIREAVKMMRRKGGGHIVNIGSMSAQVHDQGSDIYVATKSGVNGISASLRKTIGKENIRISLIEPGNVGTNLGGDNPDPQDQTQKALEGQSLMAEDIAYAVYYTITQPPRTNIYELMIGPTKQEI